MTATEASRCGFCAVIGAPNAGKSTLVNRLAGSKVAIVSRSPHPDADVDYLFVQVMVTQRRVDTAPNCGNMLCAIGPFAIEHGLVTLRDESIGLVRDGQTSVLEVMRAVHTI